MPNTHPNIELAAKYAGFLPDASNAEDDCAELFALLDEGIAAMGNSGGRPAAEVFAKLKEKYGYENV